MAQQAKSRYEKQDTLFRANVNKALVLSGVQTKVELSKRMQINLRTLCRHLAQPETFRVAELRRLKEILRMEEVDALL